MHRNLADGFRRVGAATLELAEGIGAVVVFLGLTLRHSALSFRRFSLTIREMFFSGVLSLIIILVSGLFVGMVLGLQGYETLQTYGSAESVGTLVALSLTRELGPVVSACCSPAAPARRSPPRSDS